MLYLLLLAFPLLAPFLAVLTSGNMREMVEDYDTVLARWMVHNSNLGALYVDSKERDPGKYCIR